MKNILFIFFTMISSIFSTTLKEQYQNNEYNPVLHKKLRQEKTDAILDKIAKSGYESLSKTEKEFLFNQSKNG